MTDDDDGRHRSKPGKIRGGHPAWKKGQSGNPKGPPKRDAIIDEFFAGAFNARTPQARRLLLLERLFTSALNSNRKDHAKLLELCLHYAFGKPKEQVELSGPGGKPIATSDETPARRRPTSGELRKRLDELKAKWEAGQKKAAGEPGAPPLAPVPEPTPDEGEPTP
jgi:hypothetical protein